MQAKLFFRWFDFWIGCYIDKANKAIYICPVPMVGIKIWKINLCGMSQLEYTIWHMKFMRHCRKLDKIHRSEKRLEKLVTEEYGRGKKARIHHYEFYE